MTDSARPRALGYIREHPLMTNAELVAAKQRLSDYAVAEELALGDTFVDRLHEPGRAFTDLLAAIERDDVYRVLVPCRIHVEQRGEINSRRHRLESETAARIVSVDPP